MTNLSTLIGMTVRRAKNLARKNGYSLRIIETDSCGMVSSCEYRNQRINVAVEEGKVVQIVGMG